MSGNFSAVIASLILSAFVAAPALAAQSDGTALKDLSGRAVSLESFKGGKVILNFWATWCPPCRAEMPELDELDKELRKSGEAVLLAVNLTDGARETPERVAEFLKETGYTMTVLLDEGQRTADFFGVRLIPTTFVLDAEGKVAGRVQGSTTKDTLLKLLRGVK